MTRTIIDREHHIFQTDIGARSHIIEVKSLFARPIFLILPVNAKETITDLIAAILQYIKRDIGTNVDITVNSYPSDKPWVSD